MKNAKTNTEIHKGQENHTQENCKINESPHNHPDTDCGHYVNAGPGTENKPDLNIYDNDHGKHCIVSDAPRHNLDQDTNSGPGVK